MKALAILLGIPFTLVLAQDNNGRGVKAIALANAFVAVADNSWAVTYNPAGLAELDCPEVSAFFVPQQFGLPELKNVALSGTCPTTLGTFGASVEQFGFDLYRTSTIRFGHGVSLDSLFSVGGTVTVDRVAIARYGVTHTLTFDIGLLGRPVRDLQVGCCVRNFTSSTIGRGRERLPQYVLLGLCYLPVEGFRITSEAEKDLQFPLVLKVGVEQQFFGFLSLRCGVANNPEKVSAGLAVRYSAIEFGYAGYSHPELGWTHQIEICTRWGK